MDEQFEYIGAIDRVFPPDGTRTPMATVRPLYRADLPVPAWHAITEAEIEFPSRGYVRWFEPPSEAIEGTLWQFRTSSISTYGSGGYASDQYKVTGSPTVLREVLDLDDGDPDMVRRWVAEEGLVLPFVPSPDVFIHADAELWVGPVRLIPYTTANCWILPQQVIHQPLPTVQLLRQENLIALDIDGVHRLFLSPSARPNRLGQIDWASNQVVLARVLRWLRRADNEFTTQLGLIGHAIDRAVSTVHQADLTINSSSLVAQRVLRARAIVWDLEQRKIQADELLDDLLAVPSIATELEAAQAEVLQQAEDKARSIAEQAAADLQALNREIVEAEAELAQIADAKRAALAEAEAELAQIADAKRADLAEAEAELARITEAKRAALAESVDALDSAVSERLREVLERPEHALANVAIIRTVLTLLTQGLNDPVPRAASIRSPLLVPMPARWSRQGLVPAESLTERKAVRQALAAACHAREVSPRATRPLHLAFLSGAMPILAGSGTYETLEAYASVVAAERLLWLPVPAGIVEAADLLGRYDSVAGRFIPAPGGLVDFLVYANNSKDLCIIVLDGINRSAAETYMSPILSCYNDSRRSKHGQPRRSLSLASWVVASDDPYASVSQLAWPSNVLLAGTLVDGVSVLPLPASTFASAVLIDLDPFDNEDIADSSPVAIPHDVERAREVPLATWSAWLSLVEENDVAACRAVLLEAREHGLDVSRLGRALCSRIYAASRMWGSDEHAAINDTILYSLVSQVASRPEALIEFLSEIERTSPAVERAIKLAGKVIG